MNELLSTILKKHCGTIFHLLSVSRAASEPVQLRWFVQDADLAFCILN